MVVNTLNPERGLNSLVTDGFTRPYGVGRKKRMPKPPQGGHAKDDNLASDEASQERFLIWQR